jgi:fructokinase
MTELVASNVSTSALIRAKRPSTMAFVHLSSGQAPYSFYDENTAGRMIQPSDLVSVEPKVKALFFGGISLAVEPCADTYAELLEREGAGRAVMVDPNIRPGFIANEKVYRARLARMFAKADIVKVSDEDLKWLVPEGDTLDARAMLLVAQGPALVLVTRGGEGADGYLANGHKLSVAAEKAEVVDTVGAGDTFNAGVLSKLAEFGVLTKAKVRDLSLEDAAAALAFGAKVAGVTVSRAGANPPWAGELI